MREILQLVIKEKEQQEKLLEKFAGGMEEYINTLQDSDTFYNEASSKGAVLALKAIEEKILSLIEDKYIKEHNEESTRFAIIVNDETGSRTLEDYNDLSVAKEAFEFIREHGYHLSENDESPSFFNSDVDLSLHTELWDNKNNYLGGFSNDEPEPFKLEVKANSIDCTYKETWDNSEVIQSSAKLYPLTGDIEVSEMAISPDMNSASLISEELLIDGVSFSIKFAGIDKIDSEPLLQINRDLALKLDTNERIEANELFSEPSDEDRQIAMKELNKSKDLDYK